MIRHIFAARFKDGISDERKAIQLQEMKAMKEKIPEIVNQEVGFSTGWVGIPEDYIVMTVDVPSCEDFDRYMTAPYHADYIAKTGEMYFDTDTFIIAQFEY